MANLHLPGMPRDVVPGNRQIMPVSGDCSLPSLSLLSRSLSVCSGTRCIGIAQSA